MVKLFFMSKKFFMYGVLLLLGVFAVMGASSATAVNIMRVSACGYKLGEEFGVRPFSELPGLSVSPTDTVIVCSNSLNQASMQAVFTVTVPFGYRLSHWMKTFDDPNFGLTYGEKVAGSDGKMALTVRYETGGLWMYLAPVIVFDNNRTVTIEKSPFGAGTVGTNLGVYASQKADVFKLAAVPMRDVTTGNEHSTFRRWEDGTTNYQRDAVVNSNDTFRAEFVPNSWTVTFDPNGGEVFPTSKVVTCDATYGWLPTPKLTGSSFQGWMREQGTGRMTVNNQTVIGALGPHTLKAQWEKFRFSIEGKVGKSCPDRGIVNGSGEYAYGSYAYLTAVADEGSQFERWTDGSTDSPRRILVVSNATYTAEFGVRQCDVVFNYRGSAGQLLSVSRHVLYGEEAEPPAKEEYDNWAEHKFVSWDKDNWKNVTGNHIVTALYGMETYDVTFAYRGFDGSCVTTMPQHVESGQAATPPELSVIDNWTGMSFTGWDRDFSVIRSNLTVTALYETNRYDIVFSYNSGEREVQETIALLHGETIPLDVYTAKANHWSGHDFRGWTMNGREVKSGDVATASGTIAAAYEGYAKIVFTPGKGAGEMEPLVYTNYSGVVTLPPNEFTKEGYTFVCWSGEGGKKYEDEDSVSVTAGKTETLTAEWTPIEYEVMYDVNGGELLDELVSSRARYDELFQIRAFAGYFKRDGFDFLGWCLDPTGDGKIFLPRESVMNLTNEAATVVLYAQWKEWSKSSISVKTTGDGTGSVIGGGDYYDGTNIVLQAIPDEGSVFVRWQEDGNTNATRTVSVASNATYTAWFDLLQYDVVFCYTNSSGTATNSQVKVAYGSAANPPSKEECDSVPGRSFAGWSSEDYTNVVSDLEIIAQYTNLLYVVACEAGGDGHGTVTGTNTYEWGATPSLKAIPDEGCEFKGWSDGETSAERAIVVKSNVTYGVSFARKSYQVTFQFRDANGKLTNETQTVSHGEAATAPEVERLWADHEFKGWTPSVFSTVTNNMTITANYDTFAVVVYWPNGGTGEKKTFSYPPNESATFESNDFTRVGYGFACWAESAGGETNYNDGVSIPGEFLTTGKTTDVYAVWSPIQYKLKFDANGGDGAPSEISCTYDRSVTIPDARPTRFGYDFLYWARESTGDVSVRYQPGGSYSNFTDAANAEVTLYARWGEQPPCKIVYHMNDGTEITTTQTVAIADASAAKFIAGPSREGYTFEGWTNANSTAVYKAGDSIPKESIQSEITVDFYAKWLEKESDLKIALGLSGTDVEVSASAGGWSAGEDNAYAVCDGGEAAKLTLTFGSDKTVTFWAVRTKASGTLSWKANDGGDEDSFWPEAKSEWESYGNDLSFNAGTTVTLWADNVMYVKILVKE